MKIRAALTEMDTGRGGEMNSRNANQRRELGENDRMKTKKGGSRKEKRGKNTRRKEKD